MSTRGRLDVVVIGGGPAGLAAADAAAEAGGQVLLLDQGNQLGGQVWRHRRGDHLSANASRLLGSVRPPRVSVANRATVIDAHDPNALVVSFRGRVAVVETTCVVVAAGANERYLPFPGWTLPGVVGVGGLQALIKAGLTLGESSVVIAGAGPLSLPVAATVAKTGANLRLIAEQASARDVRQFTAGLIREPGKIGQALRLRMASWQSRYRTDSWPLRAVPDSSGNLAEVVMRIGSRQETISCDWLATSAGLVPRTELGELLGCEIRDGAISVDERQSTSVEGVFAAGECTGIKGDEGARLEGAIAGLAAAGMSDIPSSLIRSRDRANEFGVRVRAAFAPRNELVERVDSETIICRCEDVKRGELDPRWSQRQAKLWTRLGMGACQGSMCGAACETLFDWGRNASRPPIEQHALGSWAGALIDPPA